MRAPIYDRLTLLLGVAALAALIASVVLAP